MATGPQARVLELLKRFNDGKLVCIESLANDPLWYGKSEKTIRRDLDVIKEYFENSFELVRRADKGETGGCYKAITKDLFESFMDKDTVALMVQTFNIAQRNNLLENLNISNTDKRILQNKIEKSNECYEFISKPYETKKGDEKLLKELEKAINWKRYITIEHFEKDTIIEHLIKPYKIVFINENFYLASENTLHETQDVSKFSIFRLSNIKSIKMHTKNFHQDSELKDFIKNIQTPFPKYQPQFRAHLIEVKLEVSPQKAKFFQLKKFFPSQQDELKEDGSLIVSYKFTQEMECESFIKSWLPYVKVISPLSLKEKIENELKTYLNI